MKITIEFEVETTKSEEEIFEAIQELIPSYITAWDEDANTEMIEIISMTLL